jgi:SAM-dependent methyltransferase/uncharacterized protein YbaR (Trm112 family)
MKIKLSQELQNKLLCPLTKGKLLISKNYIESINNKNIQYPIIDGVPVVINSNNSLFTINDFLNNENTTININEPESMFRKLIRKITPTISDNLRAEINYKKIASLLPHDAKILVLGGSIKGFGMNPIYTNESFEVIGSDVSFGPYTKIIFDAHDIPFEKETFDCVIIQAVLEHVIDPQRCVSESHRVLKKDGLVYSETPFMQQVHMKQYDFTRFTHLGHRRLFRCFDEIESGVVAGPGTALAWSYTYFLRSFGWSNISVRIFMKFAYFTSFFLKYFDYLLINRAGAYDAASGFFFIGSKSTNIISDKVLIQQFRGIK